MSALWCCRRTSSSPLIPDADFLSFRQSSEDLLHTLNVVAQNVANERQSGGGIADGVAGHRSGRDTVS